MTKQAESWTVTARQHARLLRPFSANRLSEALYHVGATAGAVQRAETALLIDMPRTAADWTSRLAEIQAMLETLAEQCEESHGLLGRLIDQADGDEARSLDAMVSILRGIGQPEEAPAQAAA